MRRLLQKGVDRLKTVITNSKGTFYVIYERYEGRYSFNTTKNIEEATIFNTPTEAQSLINSSVFPWKGLGFKISPK